MSGLGSLTTVRGNFRLVGNDAMINMAGLSSVDRIDVDLYIERNGNLENLSGLQSLRTIGDLLFISNNDAMNSLNGIDPLISIGDLAITFNDNLSDCSVLSICHYLSDGGGATIGGNLDGCLSAGEVLSGCAVATENDLTSVVSVYPNPTNGEVFIEGVEGEVVQIELYNALGNMCAKEVIENSKINLSSFPNGMYNVRIKWANEVIVLNVSIL